MQSKKSGKLEERVVVGGQGHMVGLKVGNR